MGQALHILNGFVSQIGTAVLGFNSADANSGGVMALGTGAATTTINVGTHAQATTIAVGGSGLTSLNLGAGAAAAAVVNVGTTMGAGGAVNIGTVGQMTTVKGNFTVDGTEHIIGGSTFDDNVTLGNATTDITLVRSTMNFDPLGFVGTSIPFTAGAKTISIASGAGGSILTVAAGANSTALGAGASLQLNTGAPGAGGSTYGSVYFGPSGNVASASAYQLLTNATNNPGLRYNNSTNKWQLANDGVTWVDLAYGGSIPNGTVVGDILQWSGTAWVNRTFTTLNNTAAIDIGHSAGDSQYAMSLHGQDASSAATAGGNTTIRGGAGTTSGAGGSMNVRGGATATGTAGDLNLTGGTASGAGTGGNVNINGGSHTGGTHGNILLAQDGAGVVYFGAGVNGVSFTASTGALTAIGTGSINLSVNATRRWAIDGVLVGATGQVNITAANFDKLFDGSAVTTHTHSGLASSSVVVDATTDGGALYDVVYLTAADAMAAAIATGATTAKAIGVRSAASKVLMTGVSQLTMEGALTAAIGDDLWLSRTTAGRVTNVAPSASGEFLVYIGQAKTAGASPQAYIRPERPVGL